MPEKDSIIIYREKVFFRRLLMFFLAAYLFSCTNDKSQQNVYPPGYLEVSLLEFVLSENAEGVKKCINQGADLDIRTPGDLPILCHSIKKRNFEITKLLMERGASLDRFDGHEYNPAFYFALKHRNYELAEQMLKKDPESLFLVWDPFVLISDISFISSNQEISKIIHDIAKEQQHVRDTRSELVLKVQTGDLDSFTKILNKNPRDIQGFKVLGNTLLMEVIANGRLDFLEKLIQQHVDLNQKDAYGNTPLIRAYNLHQIEVFNLLIKEGANINLPDDHLNTLLHFATLNNDIDTVKKLLDCNALPNMYNLDLATPLSIARANRNSNIESELQKCGAVDFP